MLTRDRGTAVVAGCFVVALAVAATLLVTRSGESAQPDWTHGHAVAAPLPPGVTVVDDRAPVEVVPEIEAWTGSQLLTLGVRGAANVGAVYEPETGRWREMGPLPFGSALHAPGGVWTGEEWVVVGILCRSSRACDGALAAATYDPDTDTWSPIDENPQPAAGNGRGHDRFFGRGVGMLGRDAAFLIDGQYYAFRPASRDWDWLPQPRSADPVACSAGGVLAAVDSARRVSVLAPGANAWTPVAKSPVAARAVSSVCTDEDVLVYAKDLTSVARLNVATRRWKDVAPPALPVIGAVSSGFTGKTVLFSQPAATIAYDVGTRGWRPAPSGLAQRPTHVAWTQFGYGLYVGDDGTLEAYNPGR